MDSQVLIQFLRSVQGLLEENLVEAVGLVPQLALISNLSRHAHKLVRYGSGFAESFHNAQCRALAA
jgi:hypothetical protein